MKNQYRFFVKPEDLTDNRFETGDKELINQIKNVFRLKSGDDVLVLDNTGYIYLVSLDSIDKKGITGIVKEKKKSKDRKIKINIYCSLLKKDNYELVLQKCTEIGVDAFYPVIYKNTVVKRNEKKVRWEKIVKEASEQSERNFIPEIHDPINFKDIKTKGLNLVAYEGSSDRIMDYEPCLSAGRLRIKDLKEVNIFIGPEGSFGQEEIDKMKKEGFLFFSLGENILRSETAAIISSGIISQIMLK